MNEVLTVKDLGNDVLGTPVENRATLRGEPRVAHLDRHRFAGSQSGKIHTAQPPHRPIPGRVGRVRLFALEQSVAVAIFAD